MVDQATLDHLLSNLRGYLRVLQELAAVPRADFLANPDKIGNAKYHFVVAIECAIDIANHVIASENFRFPKDNADTFAVLAEQRVLPRQLRQPLEAMARFRNRLVHVYWDVDDSRIHDYLQDSLSDLDAFVRAVTSHPW